jgi:anti-anti-sigma factor
MSQRDSGRRLRERFEIADVVSDEDHNLVLSGELDTWAGDDLEAVIISCANAARLTIDLSRLTFMDSTGVQLLILAHDLCRVRRIPFVIIAGPPQVQLVLEVAGLVDRLPILTN